MLGPTGHQDTFTRDRLPAPEDWPEIRIQGFDYPEWLNAGVELTDAQWFSRDELAHAVRAGDVVLPSPASIAHALVQDWYGGPVPTAD